MQRHAITVILILAAALRLGLLAAAWNSPEAVKTPDTADYTALRDALLSGSFDRDGQAEIFRTPGYPLFLLLGEPQGPSWWRAVLLLQAGLDVLLVYMTYRLAKTICGRGAGLWAAGFQACSAVAIASSLRILTDGLFAFLLTLAILLLVRHWHSGRLRPLALSAAVMALACYVRPSGQVYLLIAAGFLLVRAAWTTLCALRSDAATRVEASSAPKPTTLGGGARVRPLAGVGALAVFGAIAAVVMAPWVVRNAAVADYVGFSSFASDSVYSFAMPEILASRYKIPPAEARELARRIDKEDERLNGPRTPGQAARFRHEYARRQIAADPLLYARLHLAGTAGFFLPGATDVLEIAGQTQGQRGTSDVLRQEGLLAAVRHYFGGNWRAAAMAAPMVLICVLAYVGVAMCGVRYVRLRMPLTFWLVLVVIVITSLLSGPFGFPRYRTAVEPMLSLAAGAGWAWVVTRRKIGRDNQQ